MFFILVAAITGTLLIITLIYGACCLEIEMRRSATPRTAEWEAARRMPAARLGISESTLRRKLKSPGTFTFSEVWKIKRLGGEEKNDLAS